MTDRALQRAALTISTLRARLDAAEAARNPPLGLLGLGLRLPGGITDAGGFWGMVLSGADVTSEVPGYRWGVGAALAGLHDASGVRAGTVRSLRGGWLGPVAGFDAAFWGISPREAAGLDPQQRLLLECAWEALEDAAVDPLRLRGRRVGVYVGICGSDYAQLVAGAGLASIDAYHASGTQHSVASGRIAYALGLRGPAVSVDTACSSSLVALHLAARALRAGECDLALVGGVNLILSPTHSVGFSRAGMLSPDGRCKAFAAAADGYGRAEGCAVVVLGRLAEAGAGQVWAVLRGSALGQDGASGGLTVPNGPAQAEVIRAALADAAAAAALVGYVEAHGTGTALGDPIEAGALAGVFGPAVCAGRSAPLLVGSVKANLGHAEGAAGLVGLIKAALVRHHGMVPPHPFAAQPTGHVDWAGSGLRLAQAATPLAPEALVGVSSFGFSGTNAHAVLGRAPPGLGRGAAAAEAVGGSAAPWTGAPWTGAPWAGAAGRAAAVGLAAVSRGAGAPLAEASGAAPALPRRPGLFVLSARSPAALAALSAASAAHLAAITAAQGAAAAVAEQGAAEHGAAQEVGAQGIAAQGADEVAPPWAAACWTAATGRAALPYRRAVVAGSAAEAAVLLSGQAAPLSSPAMSGPSMSGQSAAGPSLTTPPALARLPVWEVAGEGAPPAGPAPLLWLFTGQGGLRPGAGAGLLAAEPAFAAAWHGACAAFAPHLPPDTPPLHAVLHGPDAARWLERPSLAQPALVALAVALAALWRARGVTPALVLGHSLGEYAAAHVAGVLDLTALARLVAGRGRLCEALAPGGMAATTATAGEVAAAVAALPARLAAEVGLAASHGAAGSTISGSPAGLAALCEALQAHGHASDRLAGRQAYHSALTEPAAAPLAALAAGLAHRAAQIPLASTLTGTVLTADEAGYDWPRHWARHLRQPVRFDEALHEALRHLGCADQPGAALALEIGPHPTLTGITRRLVAGLVSLPSLQPGLTDPLSVQQATATLWVRHHTPNWANCLPHPHRITQLPHYPWERHRHWAVQTTPAAPAQAHPLLGDRQPGPGPTWRFLARLDPALPVLSGHRIDGTPVLPAAAMLVMAQEAARLRWRPAGMAIADVLFERPLRLAEPMAVQFLLQPDGDGATWEIHAIPQSEAEYPDAIWTQHATGRLTPITLTPAAKAPPPGADIDAALFHTELAAAGLHLSDSYRGLRRHFRHDGTVIADIEVPEDQPLAPMLRLDAALQAAALLVRDAALRVPAMIAAVDAAPLPPTFRVHAKPGSADGDDIVADLTLWTRDGVSLGRIHALRLRRPVVPDPLADVAWTVAWRELPMPPLPSVVAAAEAPALATRLGALAGHAAILERLETRAAAHAAAALVALGVPATPGALVPPAEALGVVPRHQALFDRLLTMLGEEDALRRIGGMWQVTALPALSPAVPSHEPEAELLEACGRVLPALLRGKADPLELLFSSGAAAQVHRDSLWASPLSAQLAVAAAALLRGIAAPRILEIGAGTGGTTGALLPLLPPGARYVFTDIAATLLAEATARFARPGFSVRPLDIERDPATQDFGAGNFDLVVAANVLHATRDLRATLRHVHSLLAPGGTLALLECTAPPRWGELTFGLTDGWWRFADPELRTAPPMLSSAGWRSLLEAAGFNAIGVLDAGATPWKQAVILARAETQAGHWLVIGTATGAGAELVLRLASGGSTAEWLSEQFTAAALHAAIANAPQKLAGIVHLGALDVPPDADPMEAQDCICAPALRLVQVLVAADCRVPVWLVTCGAVDSGADGPPSPAQAALWGLGRVLRLEHPELTPRLLDLDPNENAVDALLTMLHQPGDEAQTALRGGRRRVARLVREAGSATLPVPATASGGATKDPPGPGQVDIAVRAAGVNFRDVLIGLGAYPDPAAALGIEALGIEALGTITAMGPAVAGLRLGEPVLAIAPGAFGSRIRAAAALTVPVAGAPDDTLAGAPVAYLTAAWTLRHLAQLRPGQRVLIHAAAGGTGLAALHVARAVGADIIAAASRGKHAFLRRLGVTHILDSRDPGALAAAGPVDVVLSSLGRIAGLVSLDCLTPAGCFLELGQVDALDAAEAGRRRPDVRFHAVDLAGEMRLAPERLEPVLREVLDEVAEGLLPPLPVTRMDRTTRALRRLQTARYPGKVVVTSSPTEGTVLITGAFGGLGLPMAKYLVERGVRHLVLAGRRPPRPPQEAAVEALRSSGASVRVVALDVTDSAALERLLDEVDAGPAALRGVVHAAGVVTDSLLAANDWAGFERVLAPKVAGAWALHLLTRERRLDFFVLCSSAAGTLGNAGQGAHAAANAVLDALAQHRESLGLPGVSIAWGPWAGIGTAVTESVEQHLAARGLTALQPEQGIAAFGAVLGAGLPHLAVMRVDWERMRAARGADPFLSEAAPVEAQPVVDARPAALPDAPQPLARDEIEAQVRRALAAVLGLPGPAAADPRRPFFEQGMDSLTSLEFRNRLQIGLGRPLPASLALDHPTVERLVAHLAGDDSAAKPDFDMLDEEALASLLDARLDGALAR